MGTSNNDMVKWEPNPYQKQLQAADELQKYYTTTSTASSAQAQLQNAYGTAPAAWTNNVWGGNYAVTPTPVEDVTVKKIEDLVMLQIINLIANYGPTVSKKICTKFKFQITSDKIDQVHKDLARAIASNEDQDLDKVINDVAKEVRI